MIVKIRYTSLKQRYFKVKWKSQKCLHTFKFTKSTWLYLEFIFDLIILCELNLGVYLKIFQYDAKIVDLDLVAIENI